jgi:hypothetical protein
MAMSISSTLIFQSVAFPPEEGEDEQTNPGIFGRNLAYWVSGFLNEAGIAAGDVYRKTSVGVFLWRLHLTTPSLHVAAPKKAKIIGVFSYLRREDSWLGCVVATVENSLSQKSLAYLK